jgi:hypothetical protein
MTFDWCRRRIAADNIEILKAAVLSQKERLHGLFVTHRSRPLAIWIAVRAGLSSLGRARQQPRPARASRAG